MYQAFHAFEQSSLISDLSTLPARRAAKQAQRSGVPCWTFIDDESLRRKLGPSGGFRTVLDKPYDRRSAHWRTAMILRFDYRGQTRHWLEIECSRSESFRSLLLSIGRRLDANDVFETALNAIADADGCKLQQVVAEMLRGDPVDVFPYTHHYNDDDSLRADLLRDFITRSFASK